MQRFRSSFFWLARGNIVMPDYRGTWFFTDTVDNTGWTETWILSGSDPAAAYATAAGYEAARALLAFDSVKITACRICNIDPPRDHVIITAGFPYTGSLARATVKYAGISDCLLIGLENSADNAFWHMFLRSMPAEQFTGRIYNAGATPTGWHTALLAYLTILKNGAFNRQRFDGTSRVVNVIENAYPLRWTSRKLGRPFDTLRGRRAVA